MIKYDDLAMAFDYASFSGMGENEAYLCLETGTFHFHTDFGDNEEELPDDIDSEKYIAVPGKHDLDLGKRLVLRFTIEVLPDRESVVRAIFSHRGAYARFKDLLEGCDKLQAWYDYEAKAQKQALLEWCQDNDIEVEG